MARNKPNRIEFERNASMGRLLSTVLVFLVAIGGPVHAFSDVSGCPQKVLIQKTCSCAPYEQVYIWACRGINGSGCESYEDEFSCDGSCGFIEAGPLACGSAKRKSPVTMIDGSLVGVPREPHATRSCAANSANIEDWTQQHSR